ncbi:MAG: peptide-methionine (S)-S-oxide reductase MsrA [Caldilineaceae bacterium SB0668_bin_21]|nr:peptide-methionine (S)-S-oxide reductase MsrA [Caldilineaceae bacterium SB0668_bin_21]MYC21712.1 peptide-methionine (S)-S-oxide reductase MsrA [Caldilineaceae bacterium SB0662_bin_25]
MTNKASAQETATLGGGCFWCLEPLYEELQGVSQVVSGYAGGHVPNPTYEQVCAKTTGHAEVIQVTFDPSVVAFREILEVFFTSHDPTTTNRQGNDVGPQYRSIILYHDEEQKGISEEMIRDYAPQIWDAPIVTELVPLDTFYVAESYHQNYYRDNGLQPYCLFVIRPKVSKFRKQWQAKLKAS